MGSGGRAVECRTVNQGDGGSVPPDGVSKLRQGRGGEGRGGEGRGGEGRGEQERRGEERRGEERRGEERRGEERRGEERRGEERRKRLSLYLCQNGSNWTACDFHKQQQVDL